MCPCVQQPQLDQDRLLKEPIKTSHLHNPNSSTHLKTLIQQVVMTITELMKASVTFMILTMNHRLQYIIGHFRILLKCQILTTQLLHGRCTEEVHQLKLIFNLEQEVDQVRQ